MRRKIFTALVIVACLSAFSTNAFAIDKRLRLMFKTAGYGAAAGLVIGAATAAMGLGGFRNVLMGTSAGMYAGIGLAAYILATPPEPRRILRQNPYAPKKPVGPDDSDDDEDERRELVPDPPQSSLEMGHQLRLAQYGGPTGNMTGESSHLSVRPQMGVWAPLFSVVW